VNKSPRKRRFASIKTVLCEHLYTFASGVTQLCADINLCEQKLTRCEHAKAIEEEQRIMWISFRCLKACVLAGKQHVAENC